MLQILLFFSGICSATEVSEQLYYAPGVNDKKPARRRGKIDMDTDKVKIWQDQVIIPTYGAGEPNRNPMFLEKRVYQGSSGKVYPYPVIDTVFDEKQDKTYTAVFLENEYLEVQALPSLGGRIYRARDKTNNYDFVYYNRVIKPALVGLAGPWISGGIEFNWPQHHRPNTFGPVDYLIDDSARDKKTLWMGERDRIGGTKMTMGITLRAGSAVIEITAELYNPTGEAQSFLWWANPAVRAHDETRSVFPPDVHAVMDHGKRDVSRFPIATGVYYKTDYSRGVDISRYKNIPVPTSYMAHHSNYDFVGGYDYRAGAGILHVADHHISPGKKQWTWGCGEFGRAWDRNLTDEDGPYVELMTGIFTDNQPDFTWLMPYSGKNFTQYFLPYKELGMVSCANKDIAVSLRVKDGKAEVKVYGTRMIPGARIVLEDAAAVYLDETAGLSPRAVFMKALPVAGGELRLTVNARGAEALSYTMKNTGMEKMPDPARGIGAPETLENTEALFLAALHLEQYRHATYEPDAYYREGLKRDPGDIRLNNARGSLLFRRGRFEEARVHFLAAKESALRHNPNPYDGEVFFNLGKALECLDKEDEAFDAYYKAVWSDAWRSQGYLKLAQIASRKGRYDKALEYGRESLYANYKNFKARSLLAMLFRRMGRGEDALKLIGETLGFDHLDFTAWYETALSGGDEAMEKFKRIMRGDPHNYITLALNYHEAGFYGEAAAILGGPDILREGGMIPYFRAFFLEKSGDPDAAAAWRSAPCADPGYCFPNTLDEYRVLLRAAEVNGTDAKARYYLGCFLYDKKRYDEARDHWEAASLLDASFPTAYRNLALYYANKARDYGKAQTLLEKAFSLNAGDARVFYELCELYKKRGRPLEEQRRVMEAHYHLVMARDDLLVLYGEVLNGLREYRKTIDVLLDHRFHPWEGGEGKVPALHVEARIGLAKRMIRAERRADAAAELEKALVYDENFGEGKLPGAQENNIYYYLGLALKPLDAARSRECFIKASSGLSEPAGALYYNDQPPHMIYYQGLALRALADEDGARSRFNKLVDYGERNVYKKQVMDYFAVSLPDFLVFDVDLDEKNKIHCYYMMALGYTGLEDGGKALEAFNNVLRLAPNHYGARSHLGDLP
jgi:tetratricopeptide (TPR) repeat protein